MLWLELGLNALPSLFQAGFQTVHDDDSALFGTFVMMVVSTVRFHGVFKNVRMDLDHMWGVRADGSDIPALLPSLARDQKLSREQRVRGGCAAENNIRLPHFFLQQSSVLAEFGTHGRELDVLPPLDAVILCHLESLHQLDGSFKAAIDDVDMVDFIAPQYKCQPDVPICLFSRAEDSHCMNILPLLEHHCRCQGGSECSELFSIHDTNWISGSVE